MFNKPKTQISSNKNGFYVEAYNFETEEWKTVVLVIDDKEQIYHETKDAARAAEIAFQNDLKKTPKSVYPVKLCKGCKAPIMWLKTVNNKSMPVDPPTVTIVAPGTVGLFDEAVGLIKDLLVALGHADFSNGNTHNGMDEGNVRAGEWIDDMKERFHMLEIKSRSHCVVNGYTPHWATCPEATKFKKPKKGKNQSHKAWQTPITDGQFKEFIGKGVKNGEQGQREVDS